MTCSDFAFVNILPITDSEDKDIKTQQGINHPIVTDAVRAKTGKLTFEHRIGFRLPDQFLLTEVKDAFRLGLRQLIEVAVDRFLADDITGQGTSSSL